ncbi:MAG: helicase-related protein, partial [Candidatus Thorarchaeota archaeon]
MIESNKKERSKNIQNSVRPIWVGSLPGEEPEDSEYSTCSTTELLTAYTAEEIPKELRNQRQLIELELLPEHRNVILSRHPGGGKTQVVTLHILNQTRPDNTFALAFYHSRLVGEELHEKFGHFAKILKDNRRSVIYYGGQHPQNPLIRKDTKDGKDNIALLSMSPYKYYGSLSKFSIMGAENREKRVKELLHSFEELGGIFSSGNLAWAKKLTSPWIVFIDEIDSFPLPTLLCMAMVVRMLRWKNNELQVILSSATLGDPEKLAQLFFGDEEYCHIAGKGRRGPSTIQVYLEEEPGHILEDRTEVIKSDISVELKKLRPGSTYQPWKNLIFIKDKRWIDISNITKTFDKYFVTLHGNMKPKLLGKHLRDFRNTPLKMCLGMTNIGQTSLDIPNVNKVVMYGLPSDPRAYIQQRARANRDPAQEGQIEIILRQRNAFEKDLATPHTREKLEAYITQETAPPFKTPRYSPISLKFALVMGVIMGFWDVKKRLHMEFGACKDPYFGQILNEMCLELLTEGIIWPEPDDDLIRPTPAIKEWMYRFYKHFHRESYSVVESRSDSKEEELGTISVSWILRYALPSQTLPFIRDNYRVDKIEPRKNKVYVKREPLQELYYYENEVRSGYLMDQRLAYCSETELSLVQVNHVEVVTQIDDRTEDLQKETIPSPQTFSYQGLYLPKKMTLDVVNTLNHLLDQLNLDPKWIKQIPYDDVFQNTSGT